MKDSPRAPMTFSMEVEPSVATVPESLLFPHPVKEVKARIVATAKLTTVFFFIM